MGIINNDKKVIRHYGVLGMKWGVRKDGNKGIVRGPSQKDRQSQAQAILAKNSGKLNTGDRAAAEWMASSEGKKLVNSLALSVSANALGLLMDGLFGKEVNKGTIIETIINVYKDTISATINAELASRISLSRYKDDGRKDLSKRQYKNQGPEQIAFIAYKNLLPFRGIIKGIGQSALSEISSKRSLKVETFNTTLKNRRIADLSNIFDKSKISDAEYQSIMDAFAKMGS